MTWSDEDDWSAPTRVAVHVDDRPEPPGWDGGRWADDRPTRRAASFGGGAGQRRGGELVREFVRRYGWRAYALPILAVVTVLALLTMRSSAPQRRTVAAPGGVASQGTGTPAPSGSAPSAGASGNASSGAPSGTSSAPVAPDAIALKSDTPTGSAVAGQRPSNTALPAGPAFPMRGTGTFRVLKGTSAPAGSTGRLYRYDIEVENGMSGVDVNQFASMVQKTLADPRSWSGHGVRVERVDSGPIDFHVTLTSVMTVRTWCGYQIHVETSCYVARGSTALADVNRVVINVARWVRGATPYVGDLTAYREYMINHEDGHAMGHIHAHQCLPGGLAPVMMEQTFGLKSAVTGQLCGANPWPYPVGAKGAPGAEQPDTPQNNEFYLGD